MIVTTVKPRAAALCICADPSYSVGGAYPAGESDGRPNGMRQDIGAEGDRTIANARERDRSHKGTNSAPEQPRRAREGNLQFESGTGVATAMTRRSSHHGYCLASTWKGVEPPGSSSTERWTRGDSSARTKTESSSADLYLGRKSRRCRVTQ